MCTRTDKDVAIHFAEVHLRTTEVALHIESQQRDVALSMAREVASGQGAILQQYELQVEREKAEQAAQASRTNSMLIGVDRQIASLEAYVQDSKSQTEDMPSYYLVQSQLCTLWKGRHGNRTLICGSHRPLSPKLVFYTLI